MYKSGLSSREIFNHSKDLLWIVPYFSLLEAYQDILTYILISIILKNVKMFVSNESSRR